MCHYHHLTLVEREKNMFFHAQDNSVSAIAKKLGRNKATISRELRRIPKMDFINLPLPNIRSQILLSPTTSSLGTRIKREYKWTASRILSQRTRHHRHTGCIHSGAVC